MLFFFFSKLFFYGNLDNCWIIISYNYFIKFFGKIFKVNVLIKVYKFVVLKYFKIFYNFLNNVYFYKVLYFVI